MEPTTVKWLAIFFLVFGLILLLVPYFLLFQEKTDENLFGADDLAADKQTIANYKSQIEAKRRDRRFIATVLPFVFGFLFVIISSVILFYNLRNTNGSINIGSDSNGRRNNNYSDNSGGYRGSSSSGGDDNSSSSGDTYNIVVESN